MKNVYELIEYSGPQYKFSVAWGYYVTSHIHREIEFGMVLDGRMRLTSSGSVTDIHPGEFWYLNPFQCHELTVPKANEPFAFLELQIPTSFFRDYFPKIDRMRMNNIHLTRESMGEYNYNRLWELLFSSAKNYFAQPEHYELSCTGDINHMIAALLKSAPHSLLTEDELRISASHLPRILRITNYIEENYSQKLLLGDLARQENLSLSYLSHFFINHFGMPFQTYLQRIRCQRAGIMLMETELSPSDISLACGFSALKYMNRGFDKFFGCTPSQYRQLLREKNRHAMDTDGSDHLIRHRESGLFEIIFKPADCIQYLNTCPYMPDKLRD